MICSDALAVISSVGIQVRERNGILFPVVGLKFVVMSVTLMLKFIEIHCMSGRKAFFNCPLYF